MPAHNLPTQMLPFIGREHEVEEICQLLADDSCHLLSLVGLGGMGKENCGKNTSIERNQKAGV